MPKVFSYVVDHDDGIAPNPQGRLCTLARCKFSQSDWPNVVELANEEDWIVGTGGVSRRSAGHDKLIYAMRVTEKISLEEYFERYTGKRVDTENPCNTENRFALLSSDFRYFGNNAIAIPEDLLHIQKIGRGFKSKFLPDVVQRIITWLKSLPRGRHGEPCQTDSVGTGCERPCGKPKPKRKKEKVC